MKIVQFIRVLLYLFLGYLITLIVSGWTANPTIEMASLYAFLWIYVPLQFWLHFGRIATMDS